MNSKYYYCMEENSMCLDIDALVRDVRSQIRGNIPEATVRIRIERLLHNYLESIGVTYQAIHERRTNK